MRVLIAVAEPRLAGLIGRGLKEEGYSAEMAMDGDAALDRLTEDPPFDDGAVQASETCESPGVAETSCGAPGTSVATAERSFDRGPSPIELSADTS